MTHGPQALGKAPTFGIRDNRSIKDQRESLPIFKLREQLIQAVDDNQVGFYRDFQNFRRRRGLRGEWAGGFPRTRKDLMNEGRCRRAVGGMLRQVC